MKIFFPYNPNSTAAVEETHLIIGGFITLTHVPKQGSLKIFGYEESQAPDVADNQFFCNYATDTAYREANRQVFFDRLRSGQKVQCSYVAVATPVTADDMNEIEAFLDDSKERFDAINQSLQAHAEALAQVRAQAQSQLTDAVKLLTQRLLELNHSLGAQLDTLKTNLSNTRADIDAAAQIARSQLSVHNQTAEAHKDIRSLLADEIILRGEQIADLQRQINQLRR